MFNKILGLVLTCGLAFGQTQIVSPDNVRTLKTFKNYVINPDADRNITTGITNASSIVTRTTGSTKLDGDASFTIDGTASAQVVKFKLNTLPVKFQGANGEFSFYYSYTTTNSSGSYKAYVENTSGTKVSPEYNLLTTDGYARVFTGYFTPSTTLNNPYYVVIESTVASPEAMLVDNVYAGDITSIGQFSAISEVLSGGTISVGAVTTAPTKASSPTVDRVLYQRRGDKGWFRFEYKQTATTGAAAGSGDYLYTLPAGLRFASTVNRTTAAIATIDSEFSSVYGIGTSQVREGGGGSGAGGFIIPYDDTRFRVMLQNAFSDDRPQSNSFFGFTVNANLEFSFEFEASIQGWSASQSAAAANQTDFAPRSFGVTTIEAVTSNPTKGTTTVDDVTVERKGKFAYLTYKFQNTGAGAGAGSGDYLYSLPGGLAADTSITGTSTAAFGLATSVLALNASGFATNGTPNPIAGVVMYDANRFRLIIGTAFQGAGFYQLTINVALQFTVKIPISGWEENQRAPTLIGSVTSNSVGALRIESARISAAGVVSAETSDWINGNCSLSTSTFTCTLVSGTFSSAPTCFATMDQAIIGSDGIVGAYNESTSGFTTQTADANTSATAYAHKVMCLGPR